MSAKSDTESHVRASVAELARRAGTSSDRAFGAWYAINFLGIDEDTALDGASADGPNDQGIDVIVADEANERTIILQAHFPESSKRTKKAKFDALLASLAFLDSPERFSEAGRPDLAEKVSEAQAAGLLGHKLAGVISFGRRNEAIDRAKDAAQGSERFSDAEFIYKDRDDILSLYQDLQRSDMTVTSDTIAFHNDRYIEDTGDYGRSFVGTVEASELVRLLQAHGSERLFARNVRYYLGTRKGGINAEIVRTASESPGFFWALNNGVTIVADSAERDDTEQNFRLASFSIVNGCQTTVSLSRAEKTEAKVLLRIVAAKADVVEKIVRYTNTQNEVRLWTVRASDSTQSRLRKQLKEHGIKYAPKPEGARRAIDLDSVIELDRLAQFLAATSAETLTAAVHKKSELFDRHYNRIFGDTITAEKALLAWRLGHAVDEARQAKLEEFGETDAITSGFLSVASTYWALYVAHEALTGSNPNLMSKLSVASLSRDPIRAALAKYASYGVDRFFDMAIDAFDDEVFKSPRSALRSQRFLDKISRKAKSKVQTLSRSGGLKEAGLTPMDAALCSARPRKRQPRKVD